MEKKVQDSGNMIRFPLTGGVRVLSICFITTWRLFLSLISIITYGLSFSVPIANESNRSIFGVGSRSFPSTTSILIRPENSKNHSQKEWSWLKVDGLWN